MKQNGILISLEGGEGAGKTEQTKILTKKFEAQGYQVVSLREPGGTVISEQIREVVLSSKNQKISDLTEVLLFQAARAQIYDEVVIPALNQGKIVLMDRTRDSSVVYQGIVRGLGISLIERLNKISTQNTYPGLTFLLDIDPELGLGRRESTGKVDRIDAEGLSFHNQVRDGYLKLAEKNNRGRWYIIDAAKPIEQVTESIWHIIKLKLDI